MRLLGIDLVRYTGQCDLAQYRGAIYVDNQGSAAANLTEALEAAKVPVLVVVDHHEFQDRLEPVFTDICRIGATATIYAEYLQEGLVTLNKNTKEHSAVSALTTSIDNHSPTPILYPSSISR